MATSNSHDLVLTRTDGTTVGLMLATDKNNKKIYQRYDDPALANQFFAGVPDYANLPPEKEMAFIQSSGESGFGQEFYTAQDPKRYYTSTGADLRFKGNAICGPKATSVALPATAYNPLTLTDGGLEIWSNSSTLTNWTTAAGTLAQESSVKLVGSYSAKLTTGGGSASIYQNMATWATAYRGKVVTVSGWVYATDTTKVLPFIDITDDAGTTSTASIAGVSGTWKFVSVSRTLDAAATYCRITLRGALVSTDSSVYFDNIVATSECLTAPKFLCEYNGDLYFPFGSALYKLNGTGNGFTSVGKAAGPITDLKVYGDYLFLACGSQVYSYMNSSGTITNASAPDVVDDAAADFFVNVAGTMYKVVKPNKFYKSTTPETAASWNTVSYVGSSLDDVTSVEADVDVPYFGKEDTVYYLDTSDTDYPLISDIQSIKRSDNCKNMKVWHRGLHVPCGSQGLVRYQDGLVEWISPAIFSTNLSTFAGQVQALAADEEYLYAILDNGTKLEIVAGQNRLVDGSEVWAWHPIQEITLTGCETAFVSSVYKKRLWLVSTSSSDAIWYIPLTTQYGSITSDTDYSFQTGGTFVTPWYHANLKADPKAYFKLTLTTEGCDASNYVTAEYQTYYTALTGTWTSIGNYTTSPTQTKYLPNTPTGTMIRFRFTLVTSSVSTTPKLVNWDCRGIWKPAKRKIIACSVKVADNLPTKDGSQGESRKAVEDAITEQNARTWPATLIDVDGTTKYVSFLSAQKDYVNVPAGTAQQEYNYNLVLEEITLS